MTSSSRTLAPALVLAAMVAANGAAPPPAQPEPQATGTAADHRPSGTTELRPSRETVAPEKRAIRVILPSPYSGKR